jgi:sugar lactone lactonase YvrE
VQGSGKFEIRLYLPGKPEKNMKHFILLTFVVALFTTACQKTKEGSENTAAADSTAAPVLPVTLKLKWETDTLLTTCESVIYDKERDVLYVANINGAPDGKDGNGFISKVSLDGKITEAQWAKGMDAPKGMGIANGKLYVADIDRVHEIDPASGKITKTHKVQNGKFLNDITTDASGKIYISDTGAGNILIIENGKLSPWLDNLNGPNGLLAEDGRLLLAQFSGQDLNTIDWSSKKVTQVADSIENADGIEALGDGAYLVSSWNGMVTHVSADWKKTVLLDTRNEQINAADIEYIQEKNLLLVPAFFKNKVMAYEVTK